MSSLANFLGLLSSLFILASYAAYLKQAIKGESTPNPASWVIWLVAGLINAFTYFAVVDGSVWQSLFVMAATFSVLVVFLYSLVKGRFTSIKNLEMIILLIALSIGVFWQLSDNDRLANLLLQIIYILSYIPTLMALWRLQAEESSLSWGLAVFGYSLVVVGLVVNYPGDWIAFVSPVVNGMLGNGAVLCLILWNKKRGL